MPETEARRLNDTRIAGIEAAARLFDTLVDIELGANGGVNVAIEWEDAVDEDGAAYEKPIVHINGTPAQVYAKDALGPFVADPAVLDIAAEEFNDSVAGMWEDTIQYYDQLDQLSEEIDELVLSPDSGYFAQAQTNMREQGIDGIGEGETMTAARRLACTAVTAWAEAVEEQQTESST